MKSGLLALCKHGIYEFMALQTKSERIFHAMILILCLFKAVPLSLKPKVTELSFARCIFLFIFDHSSKTVFLG